MSEDTTPVAGAESGTPTEPAAHDTPPDQVTSEANPPGNAEHDPAKTNPNPAPVVPEHYEFTPPDGYGLDDKQMAGFFDAAKEAGLTQDQLQRVGSEGVKLLQNELDRLSNQQMEQARTWQSEVLNDKELSDGTDLRPEIKESTARVIDTYGGDTLRKALIETGAGNNPAIIRAFVQIGKAMGASSGFQTGKSSPTPKRPGTFSELANTLYGDQ